MIAFNAIVFAPMIFGGRILSPNDVYYNYDPWRSVRGIHAHNSILHDPAFAYGTLISLLKTDWPSFHWNRWVASGIPGFGSVGSAVFSPFIIIPGFVLPLLFFFAGVVLLKLNAGCIGAYLWLREERIGRRGAAIGAVVFTGAGSYVVWWLWQGTNATTLYPFAFLFVARAFHRKTNSIVGVFVLAAAFILSGFPATVVYALYLLVLYTLFLSARSRWFPVREFTRGTFAAALALITLMPMIVPFAAILRQTGYLSTRAHAGELAPFAPAHLAAFVNPYRLGDPTAKVWPGPDDPSIFIETTVYLGLVTIPLIFVAIFVGHRKERWFWIGVLIALIALLFFNTRWTSLVGGLPGIRFSSPTRLRVLLPLAAAYLAATGARGIDGLTRKSRRNSPGMRFVVLAIGLLLVIDLARFAKHFLTYLPPDVARLPETETIAWLHKAAGPARVAPMFDALLPNSAEWMRFEDVRGQFTLEAWYRRLLQRIDPGCWGRANTSLQFNALTADLRDPIWSMLNVRYFVEQPSIDIIRWQIEGASKPAEPGSGQITLSSGQSARRLVNVSDRAVYSLAIGAEIVSARGEVRARLLAPGSGVVVMERTFGADELRRLTKIYLPLPRGERRGDQLIVEVLATGATIRLPAAAAKPSELGVTLIESPLLKVAELKDGRIFENLAALPRFYPVWSVRQMSLDAMLADRKIDFGEECIVPGTVPAMPMATIAAVPRAARRADIRIERYDSRGSHLHVSSVVPYLLVSSEKVNEDLGVRLDGAAADVFVVNGGFAAMAM
ncbi:MAG TPA: hypothetical protein VHL58_13925, partial [Thermoanaerobaculia bacterium]|nr:hypothetical protein [Thermoanaerobaculia bacterium]